MDETSRVPHKRGEPEVRPIAVFLAGLVVFTAVILLIAGGVFTYLASREAKRDIPPSPVAREQRPPEPRLVVNPAGELQKMRAAEEAHLHSYGWVDREAGVVRIPIERAITLLAERGLPARREKSADEGQRNR